MSRYHWDLPEGLMSLGNKTGWPEDEIIDHFVAYADFAYKTFGDRVKKWITFNEPWVVCYKGYEVGVSSSLVTEKLNSITRIIILFFIDQIYGLF